MKQGDSMIYAMSDIHGCLEALEEKMELVDLSGNNRIIFLGDYIDYGPDSGGVLRYLYDFCREAEKDKVVMLKGNHEAISGGYRMSKGRGQRKIPRKRI